MSKLTAASDPNRRQLRQRLDSDVSEPMICAFECLAGGLQKLHRGLEHLIGAATALLNGPPRRFKLGRVPSGANAVDEPATGQMLKRGDLLGKDDGIVGGQ